jgi:hypothetical protein
MTKYFIHKHDVRLCYGGSEEGGWWYDAGTPVEDWVPEGPFMDEEDAHTRCRELNDQEHERAKKEEEYDYSSVLSYRSTHYGYSVHETTVMTSYPEVRPHYE